MNVYLISGLGADKRVFVHLQLPEHCTPIFLDWLKPAEDETLHEYAMRMAACIDQEKPYYLIGLSFGGMLATEISKKYKPVKTILISSIYSVEYCKTYFKIAYALKLHKWVPVSLLKNVSLAKRLFTTESKEDKRLLRQIIEETDPAFIRWTLGAILSWENIERPQNIWQIHGTSDKVLPLHYTRPTHLVQGGGHLMVMNHSQQVNNFLQEAFANRN